ncbi:hypothetical protein [Photobacterium leiognathi]|uniref:hypothetical protein n=1 Tax=Photobacterium leiognathi TaxID=553611 RepID=UPI0029812867|nr:hypothetical protein [Photobacterium leiognathi]
MKSYKLEYLIHPQNMGHFRSFLKKYKEKLINSSSSQPIIELQPEKKVTFNDAPDYSPLKGHPVLEKSIDKLNAINITFTTNNHDKGKVIGLFNTNIKNNDNPKKPRFLHTEFLSPEEAQLIIDNKDNLDEKAQQKASNEHSLIYCILNNNGEFDLCNSKELDIRFGKNANVAIKNIFSFKFLMRNYENNPELYGAQPIKEHNIHAGLFIAASIAKLDNIDKNPEEFINDVIEYLSDTESAENLTMIDAAIGQGHDINIELAEEVMNWTKKHPQHTNEFERLRNLIEDNRVNIFNPIDTKILIRGILRYNDYILRKEQIGEANEEKAHTIGDRGQLRLTIKKINQIIPDKTKKIHGSTTYEFRDHLDRRIRWKASYQEQPKLGAIGETIDVNGTIKEHLNDPSLGTIITTVTNLRGPKPADLSTPAPDFIKKKKKRKCDNKNESKVTKKPKRLEKIKKSDQQKEQIPKQPGLGI